VQSCNYVILEDGAVHPERVMENTHDLVYILKGGWEIWEEDDCYKLGAGDVVFLHAGRRQYGKTGCFPGTQTMFIHFDRLFEDTTSSRNLGHGWDNTVLINSVIHCQNKLRVMNLFKEIIFNFFSGLPYVQIKLYAHLTELLYELSVISLNAEKGLTEDDLVGEILYCIGTAPNKNYTVQALADDFYICASSLNKRFKKVTGMSIYQYQLKTKLEMAYAVLLSEPTSTLKEVASTFGFCDEFHFSKLFKKKYSLSPSQVRKKNKESLYPGNTTVCNGVINHEVVDRLKLNSLINAHYSINAHKDDERAEPKKVLASLGL